MKTIKKEESNQQIPYMVVIGIVAVVAIVSLVLYGKGGIEGAVPIGERIVGGSQEYCTDLEPNNDYYVAGAVKFGATEYIDHCRANDRLYQYYCDPGNRPQLTRGYECPNGCRDGACLSG